MKVLYQLIIQTIYLIFRNTKYKTMSREYRKPRFIHVCKEHHNIVVSTFSAFLPRLISVIERCLITVMTIGYINGLVLHFSLHSLNYCRVAYCPEPVPVAIVVHNVCIRGRTL